uniref:Uncharacterized protein n=1 Tax=Arcella intermedia TaxID=1963864 RepID=A0A6B2LPV7_9EUKA
MYRIGRRGVLFRLSLSLVCLCRWSLSLVCLCSRFLRSRFLRLGLVCWFLSWSWFGLRLGWLGLLSLGWLCF